MKLRVHDAAGRERWLSAGQVVPAGWYVRRGDEFVQLAEEGRVDEVVLEGNPYDQDRVDEVYLVVTTSSERAAAEAAEAAQASAKITGEAEAARLNAILRTAGVREETARVVFGAAYCNTEKFVNVLGDYFPYGGPYKPITEADIRNRIPGWLAWQDESDRKAQRKEQVDRRKARLAKAYSGLPDVRGLAVAEFTRCGWKSVRRGPTRPDCADGEYELTATQWVSGDLTGTYGDSGESYYFSNPSGDHVIVNVVATHPEFHRAMLAAKRAYRQGRDVRSAILDSMGEIARRQDRIDAARAKAATLRAVRELRERGLRAEEARRASENAKEAARLLSIASVRRDWRRMLDWVSGSRGIRSLHPDAVALLDRIRKAQRKANDKRADRRAAAAEAAAKIAADEARAAELATKAKRDSFITAGTWGALDGLKL